MITHIPSPLPGRWVSAVVVDSATGEHRGTVVMPRWEWEQIKKKEQQRCGVPVESTRTEPADQCRTSS